MTPLQDTINLLQRNIGVPEDTLVSIGLIRNDVMTAIDKLQEINVALERKQDDMVRANRDLHEAFLAAAERIRPTTQKED